MAVWILEVRPKEWDVDKYLRALARGQAEPELDWPVDDHAADIAEGDRVYLWKAGDHKVEGIVAIARVTGAVAPRGESQATFRKPAFEEQYAATRPRVPLRVETVLRKPLYRVKLEWTEETKGLSVIGAKDGTAWPVAPEQDASLERLCEPLAEAVG